MSLRLRVKKLIERRQLSLKKSVFIIAQSKEQEERDIKREQEAFVGDKSLLMITVFRIYE